MAQNLGKFSTPVYDTRTDQFLTVMNAAPSITTANFATPLLSDSLTFGNFQIVTNAAFNGTTATLALQASNDSVTWSTAFQDDGITPVSFTLATNSTYNILVKRILYRFYRLVYTAGNATLGTISANFVGKH